jgi:hypothetical protein
MERLRRQVPRSFIVARERYQTRCHGWPAAAGHSRALQADRKLVRDVATGEEAVQGQEERFNT